MSVKMSNQVCHMFLQGRLCNISRLCFHLLLLSAAIFMVEDNLVFVLTCSIEKGDAGSESWFTYYSLLVSFKYYTLGKV